MSARVLENARPAVIDRRYSAIFSHLRRDGNDCGLECPSLANDTTAGLRTGIRQPTDSCAAFHPAFAIRNIATPLEFGKNRGGIRRLTDTSALPLPRGYPPPNDTPTSLHTCLRLLW
jgi:hypothetical protein